eukprot:m.272258 g.272258  ORF g.272258 m.272258 type:complete len:159 (-) comp19329_c0_seq23:24-500(-)
MRSLLHVSACSLRVYCQMETQDLAARLEDGNQADGPILLDVRKPEEYEVSHLHGAIRIDSDVDPATLRQTLEPVYKPGTPVVCYCSVGYRSSKLAAKLQNEEWLQKEDVYNLQGSIFKWRNEKRAVFCGDKEVDGVHPYNTVFGLLLASKHRTYKPQL